MSYAHFALTAYRPLRSEARRSTTGLPRPLLYIWRCSRSRRVGALTVRGRSYPSAPRHAQVDRADALLGGGRCPWKVTTDGSVGHRFVDPRDGGRRACTPAYWARPTGRARKAGPSAGRAVCGRDAWSRGGIGHLPGPVQHDGKPWMVPVSGSLSRAVFVFAALFSYAAGEPHHRGAGPGEAPRHSRSPPRRRTRHAMAEDAIGMRIVEPAPELRRRVRDTNMHASEGDRAVSSACRLVSSYPQELSRPPRSRSGARTWPPCRRHHSYRLYRSWGRSSHNL